MIQNGYDTKRDSHLCLRASFGCKRDNDVFVSII